MGLDMEIRAVRKPTEIPEDFIFCVENFKYEWIERSISKLDIYSDLEPFLAPVTLRTNIVDKEKICLRYGADPNKTCFIRNGNTCELRNLSSWDLMSKVSESFVDEECTKSKIFKALAYEQLSIKYWRKNLEIRDWMHSHIPKKVGNMGMYRLKEGTLRDFCEAFPNEEIKIPVLSEKIGVFYWEWY